MGHEQLVFAFQFPVPNFHSLKFRNHCIAENAAGFGMAINAFSSPEGETERGDVKYGGAR